MIKSTKSSKGVLSVELVVAMTVLVTIAGVLLAMNRSFGQLNRRLWAKHICTTAAQARMDAMTAGNPVDEAALKHLWPDVSVMVETAEGTGPWKGLQKVEVTAVKTIKSHPIEVRLTRYLPPVKGGADEN